MRKTAELLAFRRLLSSRSAGRHRRFLRALLATLILLAYGPLSTLAQAGEIEWTPLTNLSTPGSPTRHSVIVADLCGYVHVFWSEDLSGAQRTSGDTVFYTRWDGESWLSPTDVLAVSGEDVVEYIAVDVDQECRLHAVWTGQSLFYYSSAPGLEAHSARAWTAPVVIAGDSARSQLESDILVDGTGHIHVVYATQRNAGGIYHIRSDDRGLTWALASPLSQTLRDVETSFGGVKIIQDGAGRLHVVWQTFHYDGLGQAVYYARSVDRGATWEPAVELAWRDPEGFETGWPYLTSRAESELHLIYVDGIGSVGRFHRISRDGGATWDEPRHVITDMVGVNGYVIPVVDGSGGMHLFANMRPSTTQVTGIYYAYWLDGAWSSVTKLTTGDQYAYEAHRMDASVRLGNELHVVFYSPASSDVWTFRGRIAGLDSLQAMAVPTASNQPSTTLLEQEPRTPEPSQAPQPSDSVALAANHAPGHSQQRALANGVMSALLLVSVSVWIRSRSRRH